MKNVNNDVLLRRTTRLSAHSALSRHNMHTCEMHVRNRYPRRAILCGTYMNMLTDRPTESSRADLFPFHREREKMPRNENHCRFTLNYFLQNYSAAFSASGGHRVHKHIIHTVAGACVAREYFDKTNVHDFIFFVVSTHTHWSQNELAVFISQPVGSSLNYISIQHLGGIKWYESERETEFAERRNQAK